MASSTSKADKARGTKISSVKTVIEQTKKHQKSLVATGTVVLFYQNDLQPGEGEQVNSKLDTMLKEAGENSENKCFRSFEGKSCLKLATVDRTLDSVCSCLQLVSILHPLGSLS